MTIDFWYLCIYVVCRATYYIGGSTSLDKQADLEQKFPPFGGRMDFAGNPAYNADVVEKEVGFANIIGGGHEGADSFLGMSPDAPTAYFSQFPLLEGQSRPQYAEQSPENTRYSPYMLGYANYRDIMATAICPEVS